MVQWQYLDRTGKRMHAKPRTPEETYAPALEKARKALAQLDAHQVAVRAAVSLGDDGWEIPYFGAIHYVKWPEGLVLRASDGQEADTTTSLLLMHYLLTADGIPQGAEWIAFRNLSGGMGYDAAFQGRANVRLARTFGRDRAGFEAAARTLGGEPLSFGDASFCFRLLPRVWLAVVLHLADDEFPATANVLFDNTANHYLPTEDLAVLGGVLAGRLIKAPQGR
jgi:Domain of unknown function (DUF3786)